MNAVVEQTDEQTEDTKTKAKSAVETVEMLDGRKVDFVGKRKLLKEVILTDQGVSIRLDFRNGMVIDFPVPQGLLLQFAGHGASQKLGDETAGIEDGPSQVDDMVMAVEKLIARLNKGEWATAREGGGMSGTSILLQALVEFSGKTPEQIKKYLQGDPESSDEAKRVGKTAEQKRALRNSKELKPIVERLEAAKASKATKVDTQSLLGELA